MSKALALALVLVFLTASSIITFLPVKAETKTIIVPDDYPTIASAIGNATNGDTIFVKEGEYDGPINQTLIIDKSLWIIGENAKKTVINLFPAYGVEWIITTPFYGHTDAINIKANDVALQT